MPPVVNTPLRYSGRFRHWRSGRVSSPHLSFILQLRRAASLLLLASVLTLGFMRVPSASQTQSPEPRSGPIDFAVAVDASGSVPADALQEEKEATSLLVQGEISARSRGMLLAFAGADNSGRAAVDEICPLTQLDSAGRQRLGACVEGLNRESAEIGSGTDFPAVIRQAVNSLGAAPPGQTPRILFLLTDGNLDVRDDPAYGPDPSSRQANAKKSLRAALQRARAAEVQVWPLGFGEEIDKRALQDMASSGYQEACAGLPEAKPQARTVSSPTDVDTALLQTFAGARCAHLTEGTSGRPPDDLHVTLPPIATDATIVVIKRDPAVRATYSDPNGRKIPLDEDNPTFQVSGLQSTVQGLRVQAPVPGEWTVHMDAPSGHRGHMATVGAIWQGVVYSSIETSKSDVQRGEKISVLVQMQNRQGVPVTDLPQSYNGRVSARLTGQGIQPLEVELHDAGKQPDSRSGDGIFGSYLTIPKTANKELTLTSTIAAPGITGDTRPSNLKVVNKPPPMTVDGTISHDDVHSGQTVSGTLRITNTDSKPHQLHLILQGTNKAVSARISPVDVSVPAGSSHDVHHFTISVKDRGALPEMIGGRVAVVDRTDADRHVKSLLIGAKLVSPPGPPLWPWVTLGVVLLLSAVLWELYQRWRYPKGLRLVVSTTDGSILGGTHRVQTGGKGPYRFVFHGNDVMRSPKKSVGGSWQIQRRFGGRLLLKDPHGRRTAKTTGGSHPISDGRRLLLNPRRFDKESHGDDL